jgi:hypothetical protein
LHWVNSLRTKRTMTSHDEDDFECIPGLNQADLNKLFQQAIKETASPHNSRKLTRKQSSVSNSVIYGGSVGLALLFLCLIGYYSKSSETVRTQADANQDLSVKYAKERQSISIVETIVSRESAPRTREEAEDLVLSLQQTATRHDLPLDTVPSTDDIDEDGSIQWIAD